MAAVAGMLGKLFNVHSGEWSKVLHFALLGAILQSGLAIGISSSDSIFLVQAGPENLPIIYLLTPALMLFYIPLHSWLLGRLGIDRVFDITMILLGIGGVAISFAMGLVPELQLPWFSTGLLYGAKLYTALWYVALYTLFWNFVDGYFDILDAKRLFALLSAGSALGASLGGAAVTILTGYIQVQELFLVWSVLALLALPIGRSLRARWKKLEVEEDPEAVATGFFQQTKDVLATFKRSSFAKLLTMVLFSTMIVTMVVEYQYMAVLSRGVKEAELAALFGQLFLVVNIFNIVISLFVFSRLVSRFGVRNVAMVQPLVYAATFAFFLIDDSRLAGLVGFFAFQGMLTSVDYNNSNLLLNALPAQSKKQLRTFIEGLCEPLASATAGLFLFVMLSRLSFEQISALGMAGALACLLLVLCMRMAYVQAMVINLKRGWLDFSRPVKEVVTGLSAPELNALGDRIKHLQAQGNSKGIIGAIRIVMANDRHIALDALLAWLKDAPESEYQNVTTLLAELLANQDDEITEKILLWLEETSETLNPLLVQQLGVFGLFNPEESKELLNQGAPQARAAAAILLRNSRKLEDILQSKEIVYSLITEGSVECMAGIRALGQFGTERYAMYLCPFLKNKAPDVRRETLLAMKQLCGVNSGRLIPDLLQVVCEGSATERLLSMEILAKIGDADCLGPLLMHAESFGPAERRAAEKIIMNVGLKGVPASVQVLRDPAYPYSACSIAARALSRLSFPQFEALSEDLIQSEIERCYDFIYFQQVLGSEAQTSAGVRVLSQFYADIQNTVVEFVLEILALSGKIASFELISASLRSSNQKVRGNAIETVEQGCGRKILHLLLPLLDSRRRSERNKISLSRFAGREVSLSAILDTAIGSTFQIEACAAAQALWDRSDSKVVPKLRATLKNAAGSKLGATILTLLSRGEATTEATIVEKIDLLSRIQFFDAFHVGVLESIAEGGLVMNFADGEKMFNESQSADRMFVVEEGSVILHGEEGAHVYSAPALIGQESALGAVRFLHRAVSGKCKAIALSRELMMSLARSDTRVAIELLAEKTGMGRYAAAD